MLVLSRKKNESFIIDDHIRVTVIEVRGDRVRLGIEAPKDIPVHREEVYAAITAGLTDGKSVELSPGISPEPSAASDTPTRE